MITNPGQAGGIGRAWDRFAAPTERVRRPFRRWRRGRPFYAGISILLAALEISMATQSGLGKLLSMGVPGVSTVFISVFLAVFAVTVWFFPAYRVFSGIAAIMIALLSLIATNLGGFLLGFLLAMLGGSFAVAWTPRADYSADTRRQRRKAAALAVTEGGAATQSTEGQGTASSSAETQNPESVPEAAPAGQAEADTIEQYARSDEAAPVAPESSSEEE